MTPLDYFCYLRACNNCTLPKNVNNKTNKIFNAMISPILTLNSEVWGAYTELGQFPDRKNTSPIM